ncbi:hypothetical protein OG203_35070 [Nocardia sp. NBC_01499]|uniref:YbaB/EbfC family nucleoid-associated protein n=1 Tax=Nocardia sp. NBC_01499 TaxID=2903597 RepID=UPI00386BDDE1
MTANMNTVEMLTFALSERRTTASDPTRSVTVEVTADGAIHSIRLSDAGRQIPAERLAAMIKQLHTRATAEAQQAVKDIVAGFVDASPGPAPIAGTGEGGNSAGRTRAVETGPESDGLSVGKGVAHPSLSPTPVPGPTAASQSAGAAAALSRVPGRSADVVSYDDEDEDEYYRNFSITQVDDYRPRSNRPDNR